MTWREVTTACSSRTASEARLPLCSRVHVRLTGYTVHANASRRQQNHVKVCTSVLAPRQAGGWMVPRRSSTSVFLRQKVLSWVLGLKFVDPKQCTSAMQTQGSNEGMRADFAGQPLRTQGAQHDTARLLCRLTAAASTSCAFGRHRRSPRAVLRALVFGGRPFRLGARQNAFSARRAPTPVPLAAFRRGSQ